MDEDGAPERSPIAIASSIAFEEPRASLRMWVA